MAKSHLSGPILGSGKPSTRKFFQDFPYSNDPDYVHFMDDFTGIALDTTNDWTSISDSSTTLAITDNTANGLLNMQSQATTDDSGTSILGNEVIALAAGRDIWFETKLQSSDADQQEICIGMAVDHATNPEAMLTAADRIHFQVDDGSASILCVTEKNGTATSTDSQVDLVDATDIKLGFHVKGTTAVEFYVNRNLVATHTTNLPDDEELALGAYQLSGNNTGTKSVKVDYIMCVWTR